MMHQKGQASGKNARLVRNELIISFVLRYGVLLCGLVIAIGVLGRLLGFGVVEVSSSMLIQELLAGGAVAGFHPVVAPGEIARGMLALSPDVWMAAGVSLLISLLGLRAGVRRR
jgi:uncharacterized membrane protein